MWGDFMVAGWVDCAGGGGSKRNDAVGVELGFSAGGCGYSSGKWAFFETARFIQRFPDKPLPELCKADEHQEVEGGGKEEDEDSKVGEK